jgi:4'-phosphopantetheinyl transferase
MTHNAHITQIAVGPLVVYCLCEVDDGSDDPFLLAPAEAAYLAALRTPKRRHDWLLGRRVAKRLIHAVLAAQLGRAPALNEIVILPHPDGWPQVSLPTPMNVPPLTLSISHSRDRAFCVLTFGADRPLGGDIEAIEPRSPGFVADYFTADERAFMAAAPEERHPTLANAIWSGKEAALKAIRRGLAEDTRLVTCLPSPTDIGDGWRELIYRWEVTDRDLPALGGRWRETEGYVMTLATTGSQPNLDTGRGAPV